MKKMFLTALLMAGMLSASAQTKGGGISEDMLSRIRQSYAATPAQKAVKNALASTSMATLAINSENLAMMDTHFSHKFTLLIVARPLELSWRNTQALNQNNINFSKHSLLALHSLCRFQLAQLQRKLTQL